MMKSLKLERTFHEGWQNFHRNGWLTAATIVVMTLSLFVVSLTLIFGVATRLVLANMEEKITVNVAFDPDVSEEHILIVKQELEKYREVASIEYTSRDQALEDFLKGGGNDPVIAQALQEIGDNPLLASLTIKASHPDQYDMLAVALGEAPFAGDIARINYEKNKRAIERLAYINHTATNIGLILGAVFIAVAILVTFNTVRMNIYSRRQEFEIMRLVGASNLYVRMPSVFEGIFYGLVSATITMLLLFGGVELIASSTRDILPEGQLLGYYGRHFLLVFVTLILLGSGLGALSGYLALTKYLKT